jgi:hypothetical protein
VLQKKKKPEATKISSKYCNQKVVRKLGESKEGGHQGENPLRNIKNIVTELKRKIPLLLSFVSSDFTLYSLRSSSPASCSFTAHTKGPPCTMEQQLKS